MSQLIEQVNSSALEGASMSRPAAIAPGFVEPGFDDFAYKPLPPLAPVSVLLGVCALSGLLSPMGLPFGLIGGVLGLIAWRQIRKAEGALTGKPLSVVGMFLSTTLLVTGIALHIYWYQTEVPEGHRRISFSQDISQKGFIEDRRGMRPHPDVEQLVGENLFVKGFMYPGGQVEGLHSFILCRDNGQCCFGGQPKIQDMIKIKMRSGLTARHTDGMVSVAGVFRLRNPGQAGNLEPAYELEATHFTPSKTSY